MRFDVAVHFVASNNTYQAQVMVRKRVPGEGDVEAVTLTFSTKHSDLGAAIDEAMTYADAIRSRPEPYRMLLDQVFRQTA